MLLCIALCIGIEILICSSGGSTDCIPAATTHKEVVIADYHTFVDNVIRIDRKLLPVEIKLNIKAESDLEGQCEQYCKLDNIVLSKNAKQPVNMKNLIDDRVLVIDTFAVYMFFLKDRNIKFLCDLDELKSEKDIQLLKNKVLQCIRNT